MTSIYEKVENEIHSYLYGTVEQDEGVPYSEYLLKKRIAMFEARQYPTGKTDELGRYLYWYDIITPRRNDEVKNLRVDSDNFNLQTDQPGKYFPHTTILNAKRKEFLEEHGYAVTFKEDVEQFSGWGNILWKRVANRWKRCNLKNIYLTNTLAETVHETDVIERYLLTAAQVKKMTDWENTDEVIKDCGERMFNSTKMAWHKPTFKKYYEFFERTGEVTERQWNELHGKKGGDDSKSVLCKIIFAGLKSDQKAGKYVVFKERITSMDEVFTEAHRGAYKGRWMREGLIELLFDYQVRANEIGIQIANGLEGAARTLYRSTDVQTYQNVLTDLEDGAIVNSADLAQVNTRLDGLDQLIADWNRNLQEADRIANSFEITRGEELKAGAPFRMGLLIDQNNNKLFIVLRMRLTAPYRKIWKTWVLPEMVKTLKGKELVRLSDDSILRQLYVNIARNWYRDNAAKIGPVPREVKDQLIMAKVAELSINDGLDISLKDINWTDALKTINLNISGENDDADEKIADISGFLGVEQRPGVRNYLLDRAYQLRGIDIPEDARAEAPSQPNPPGGSLTRDDTIREGVSQLAEANV